MSDSEMQAELEHLLAETPQLRNKEKGGVYFYGLGRFRVARYKDRWLLILPSIIGVDVAGYKTNLDFKAAGA